MTIQVWLICDICDQPFLVNRGRDRRFCSATCRRLHRSKMTTIQMTGNQYRKGKPNASAIEAMRLAHLRPEVAAAQSQRSSEVFKALHASETFIPGASRTRLPRAQKLLLDALGLPIQCAEVPIGLSSVRSRVPDSPRWCKADIVHPDTKTVIECDGESHRNPWARDRDEKRTQALRMLGYEVIRFWNGEVMNDLDRVVKDVQSVIESRSQVSQSKVA